MVKLKYCDRCACDMPVHFRKCPSCGAPNRQRFWSKWWVKGIGFMIVLVAIYYLSEMSGPIIEHIKGLI